MTSIRTLCLTVAICSSNVAAFAEEKPPVSWEALAQRTDLRGVMKCKGRDQITAEISNRSAGPVAVAIPAGLVCELADRSGRILTLSAAVVNVDAGATMEVNIPAAALSVKTSSTPQSCAATRERLPGLDSLLAWLAKQPDAPRATAQLAVLSLVENIGFSQWQDFLLAALPTDDPSTHPTPAEVVQAIDALAILREVAPATETALAKDAGLKSRALRNPFCRAKAAALYGIGIPNADGTPGEIPSLGQLLHRTPNDNCPVCRLRSRAQQATDGF